MFAGYLPVVYLCLLNCGKSLMLLHGQWGKKEKERKNNHYIRKEPFTSSNTWFPIRTPGSENITKQNYIKKTDRVHPE